MPNRGVRLSTDCFTLIECRFLCDLLKDKYGLKSTIHKAGGLNPYSIYVPLGQMPKLRAIVLQHIHPTMIRKVRGSIS